MEHARPEDQTVLDLCARTPQVARFLGISAGLLRVEAPANANSIAASFRERLSSLGFPDSQRVARKQLSDHVAKSLPHAWSDRALPTLARHRPGTADDVLDSIFSEQAWSKTAAPYIAVAAAIWDDESEALAAFMIPRRNHSDLGHPELAAAAA
jgi:hypothetical protein